MLQLQGQGALPSGVGRDDPVELDHGAAHPVYVLAIQLHLNQLTFSQGRVPIASIDRHRSGMRDVPALCLAKPDRPCGMNLGCGELAQIVVLCWRGFWGVGIGHLRGPEHPGQSVRALLAPGHYGPVGAPSLRANQLPGVTPGDNRFAIKHPRGAQWLGVDGPRWRNGQQWPQAVATGNLGFAHHEIGPNLAHPVADAGRL